MLPPKKQLQQQRFCRTAEAKMRPRSVAANWNVLAERTQRVAPVGAWVEIPQDYVEQEESPAFAIAAQIEEEYKEQQKEKELVLKRFQEEVKHRVNQHVKLRRKQQLQKSYEAVRKTVQQVRRRLASRKAVSEGDALPGGVWESHPRTQKSESCKTSPVNAQEGDSGEFPLVGFHDLPAELREQERGQQERRLDYTVEFQKVNGEILKGNYPGGSSVIGTETRAARIFWPGREIEDSKKQRQSQYLRYRRLFMDIEREQVKEQQRQKTWQRKMDKIKKEKERRRYAEEQRIQERASHGNAISREKWCENLEELKLEDTQQKQEVAERQRKQEVAERQQKKEAEERQQRNKEYSRYVEALRALMREKIKTYNINLPPLCFCGSDFWDAHPDSCANNCVFYKNHKAYAQALQSVISSCNVIDGGSNTRLAVHTFASVHARSKHS
ncbi:coiled-coil domain-containing protein 15 [Elgaria multicarinata webbii]|uniref:coiled-coil domain-containing protein 15 n=1 Tax=Elgaria multicarinata webbii TaxID=159646 RepID=UPI002FCD261A